MKISRIAVITALLMTACTVKIPDIDIPNCKELGFNPMICNPDGDGGVIESDAGLQDGAADNEAPDESTIE